MSEVKKLPEVIENQVKDLNNDAGVISKIENTLNKGLKEIGLSETDISFSGSYESHMHDVKQHQDKYMSLERKANDLERNIQRGKESANRMSEVRNLRNEAQYEKNEMERSKSKARNALESFRGKETELEESDGIQQNTTMNGTPSFGGHTPPLGACARKCWNCNVPKAGLQ